MPLRMFVPFTLSSIVCRLSEKEIAHIKQQLSQKKKGKKGKRTLSKRKRHHK